LSDYAKELFETTFNHISELDEIIEKYSNGWKLNRIPKVNLSILRLALSEIIYIDSDDNLHIGVEFQDISIGGFEIPLP